MIEHLERRTFLTASLVNGRLTLTSVRFGGEEYTVTADPVEFTVDIASEGFHAQYPRGMVTSLVINTNTAGAATLPGDVIDIESEVTIPTTINGTPRDDIMFLGGGNTSVVGSGGADLILGGAGNDTIDGGAGRAMVGMEPPGDDTIFGGGGNDRLLGGSSPIPLLGAILVGGSGNDTLIGGGGRDIMDGGSGTDVLSYEDKDTGTPGVDVIFPNLDNPDFNAMMPITPANFPKIGFGTIMLMQPGNVRVQNE